MRVAYTIPDTPRADVRPGQTGFKTVPINRMGPRSFITNVKPGAALPAGTPTPLRGIAFGGDTGVGRVDHSSDGGTTWQSAELGRDEGKYGFRRWEGSFTLPAKGAYTLMVRCTNSDGVAQPNRPNWNPSGFMRNVIEATPVVAG
jgi:hypothetical protein